jgi:uncharacterized protein YbjT (DUF2867 family)
MTRDVELTEMDYSKPETLVTAFEDISDMSHFTISTFDDMFLFY